MPLHMDISPLHRLVVIVARGHTAAEEIAATTRQLVEANVPAYVEASGAPDDAVAAGVPDGGAILVRPDGFIGFRAVLADEATMAALDAHLATYLVPGAGARRDHAAGRLATHQAV
jgi:hypothetical protein